MAKSVTSSLGDIAGIHLCLTELIISCGPSNKAYLLLADKAGIPDRAHNLVYKISSTETWTYSVAKTSVVSRLVGRLPFKYPTLKDNFNWTQVYTELHTADLSRTVHEYLGQHLSELLSYQKPSTAIAVQEVTSVSSRYIHCIYLEETALIVLVVFEG